MKDLSKGFSLIELVSVIAIAAVLTVTAGNLLSTDVFDERGVYEDALSGARYAQKLAVARGCAVQFFINHSSFGLMGDVECLNGHKASFAGKVYRPYGSGGREGGDLYSNDDFPASLSVSSATVVFYPQGWACDSAGLQYSTIEITFVGASRRTLNVECGTGFVYGESRTGHSL